ncbi:MAG: hypothetical protein RL266_1775 [Bacteroidota bacterium]|jgi:hypothetical protein
MNMIDHTATWVNGEVLQGKIMLGIGIPLLIGAVAIFRSDNEILKGALIPLGFATVVLIGYGGFLTFGRPNQLTQLKAEHSENAVQAVDKQVKYLEGGDKTYSLLKKLYPIFIIISVSLTWFLTSHYYKGMAIGFAVLFVSALVIDTLLHHRLKIYLDGLYSL